MRKLIEEAKKVRSDFYRKMSEPDDQVLGVPATPTQIKSLENLLKLDLPKSYKEFLSLHNGWKMIDPALDLYSCEEVMAEYNSNRTALWRKTAIKYGEDFASNCIIIGGSKFARAKLILNPNIEIEGEMQVIDYDGGVEEVYPSFRAYLEKTTADYKEVFPDDDFGGFDFSNI